MFSEEPDYKRRRIGTPTSLQRTCEPVKTGVSSDCSPLRLNRRTQSHHSSPATNGSSGANKSQCADAGNAQNASAESRVKVCCIISRTCKERCYEKVESHTLTSFLMLHETRCSFHLLCRTLTRTQHDLHKRSTPLLVHQVAIKIKPSSVRRHQTHPWSQTLIQRPQKTQSLPK